MDTKLIRNVFNLTQLELSNFLGVSIRTVQNWDSKHTMPDYVESLCKKTLRLISKIAGQETYTMLQNPKYLNYTEEEKKALFEELYKTNFSILLKNNSGICKY